MTRLLACLLLCAPLGCIRAPEIVLVDRATALEQQAAGSFVELERKLLRAGAAAQPVALTPDQLETLGIRPAPLVDATEQTDADRVDGLLKQHCIGEARDGTLADTHESCKGAADHAEAVGLVDRANRARQQLWRWMQSRRPEASLAEVRQAWTKVHLRGLVCGGWLQREDGEWEAKKC
ncbi:MAG TPA: DUF1318 domain-containing protein [Kofleriaceae bacterium]|nr:DUF1318 domain-containing protein [Kofleriaceae bacterium]